MSSTTHTTCQPVTPLPDKTPTVLETHQLISHFLPDFLRLTEPDSAARMDLKSCTILPAPEDNETNIIFAQVRSSRGEGVTVIVAIEPVYLAPEQIARKLAAVLVRSELIYGNPVLLSVLYLSGGTPGPTPRIRPDWHLPR